MRVTVCELPDDSAELEQAWPSLAAHCRRVRSELVVLPEVPFHPWFGATPAFDAETWRAAEDAHVRWLSRLPELAPASVIATAPATRQGRRVNEAFVWDERLGRRAVHEKSYLPDEEGVWEAHWYARGDGRFEPVDVGSARLGLLVCTEIWAIDRARAYGRAGAHLLVTPRLTERRTTGKWLAAGRVAAVVAGAYSLSSNRASESPDYGGAGWIISPDGDVLAVTSASEPFATSDVDLAAAVRAKLTYPRYALD